MADFKSNYGPPSMDALGKMQNPFMRGAPSLEQQIGGNPFTPDAKSSAIGHQYANNVLNTAGGMGVLGGGGRGGAGAVMPMFRDPIKSSPYYDHVKKIKDGGFDG